MKRRFFVPEAVQTSATDCGPAVLESLLGGFHLPCNPTALRDACRTDVDGTSITAVEETAADLGLDVRQVLLPVDHLLKPNPASPTGENLPAVLVVVEPSSETHFIIVWRRVGRFVQIMDPATGRHWIDERTLLRRIYEYSHVFPAKAWRSWAAGEEFLGPLSDRLRRLGASKAELERLPREALEDSGWRSLATLDAAVRLAEDLVGAGGLERGDMAVRLVAEVFARARTGEAAELIPESFYSISPEDAAEEMLRVRGALLIQVRGTRAKQAEEAAPKRLSAEAVEALQRPGGGPWTPLWQVFRERGSRAAVAVSALLFASAFVVVFEALAFYVFFDLTARLPSPAHRLGALAALLTLVVFSTAGSFLGMDALLRFGRRLEVGLRMNFLRKLPRLKERYFGTRLRSDLAERVHSAFHLRGLPLLAGELIAIGAELACTVIALLWLDPRNAFAVLALALFAVAAPLVAQPLLAERDLRVRRQTGALSRFYLDALLGHFAARAHGAEATIRREHGRLLARWTSSGLDLLRASTALSVIQRLLTYSAAVGVVVLDISRDGVGAGTLLFTYWALKLPGLADALVQASLRRPYFRSLAARLGEPLSAEETEGFDVSASPSTDASADASADASPDHRSSGADVRWRRVEVRSGEIGILHSIDLHIAAGEHVAVMGSSGAGKSSLLGTLLGWNAPSGGEVLVDGLPLYDGSGEQLARLRRDMAWVDPAVQLWNRPLIENLRYGATRSGVAEYLAIAELLDACKLQDLVHALPQGLDTALGEGGALVSGGEGQRVRFARALGRAAPRLALLDEPFRGLDPETRRDLLQLAREHFHAATLLCVTHDPRVAESFDRIVVIEGGRIVEDGSPERLKQDEASHFCRISAADAQVHSALWGDPAWRRLQIVDGRLQELGEEVRS